MASARDHDDSDGSAWRPQATGPHCATGMATARAHRAALRHRHSDRKGSPGPTPPPSPLLYYEGAARCQVFDKGPIKATPILRKGDGRRSSCIVVAREVGCGWE